MPYLKITSLELPGPRKAAIAETLTDELVRLCAPGDRPAGAEALRARTIVRFVAARDEDLYVGGRRLSAHGPEVVVEIGDLELGGKQRERLLAELAPMVARLYGIAPADLARVHLWFS